MVKGYFECYCKAEDTDCCWLNDHFQLTEECPCKKKKKMLAYHSQVLSMLLLV